MQAPMKGLLFITHQTEKYSYLDSIQIALAGGCRQIQLRMKDIPVREVEQTASKAKVLCDQHNVKLFIDDHVEICLKVRAAGVHLGKLDMSPSEARIILGKDFSIGGTANTFEDIQRLSAEGVDYIGLGPFRFTTTKKNLSPLLGLSGYKEIINSCRKKGLELPILAIGGITPEDIPAIMETGVSGIALSSSILQASDPVKETNRIMGII